MRKLGQTVHIQAAIVRKRLVKVRQMRTHISKMHLEYVPARTEFLDGLQQVLALAVRTEHLRPRAHAEQKA
jgi:hypothetical protein